MKKYMSNAPLPALLMLTLAAALSGLAASVLGAAYFFDATDSSDQLIGDTSTVGFWIGALLVVPFLETFVVMALMPAASGISMWRAALCGGVMGVLHCSVMGWGAVGSYFVFFLNGLIYACWRERTQWQLGFLAAFLVHGLHNLSVLLVSESLFHRVVQWIQP